MAVNETIAARSPGPDISLVMPCFNEDEIVGYSIPRLVSAFNNAGYRLELIAVDNGSSDRTGSIIQQIAAKNGSSVVYCRVEQNIGYGNGLLSGFPLCSAPWVGIIPADGQVDAEDVVRLFDSLVITNGMVLGKVRRRFRMDGLKRKVISVFYNLFVWMLWPGIGTLDVNGNPKIFPRELLLAMNLKSKGWCLDPEIMIKTHYMGVRVLELNVFARMRGNGISHVRSTTCFEFLWNLLTYRFTNGWRREIGSIAAEIHEPAGSSVVAASH